MSTFTSANWELACPTGATGLSQGCFINAASAASSAIGANISTAFNMYNTTPTSVDAAVYVRKFAPGYNFTAQSNKAVGYNAATVATTTRVICDLFLENGTQPDLTINNDPTQLNGVFNVFFDPIVFLGGNDVTREVLVSTPGVGSATALAVPLYVVCIGLNTTTNEPVPLTGFSAS